LIRETAAYNETAGTDAVTPGRPEHVTLAGCHPFGDNPSSSRPTLWHTETSAMRLLQVTLSAGLLALTIPLLAAEDTAKVQVGQPAPNIDLPATQVEKVLPGHKGAKTLKLSDVQKGVNAKNIVLFFYPKAMTRGCTKESCQYRDRTKEFAKLDTVILGISTDKLDAQQEFTEKEHLNFPLLADPEKKVTKAYGVLRPEGNFANRVTFVIDKKGIVRKIYTKVDPEKNPDEVLAWIKENLAK
jgi:thioredoxin-dependent peroxiredoxin